MFVVIEMQVFAEDVATLTYKFSDYSAALNKYHLILSSAAVSQVPVHSAIILDKFGRVVKSEYFNHEGELPDVDE